MIEQWKQLDAFPEYLISSAGRVYSLKSSKLLTPIVRCGTKYVNLCTEGIVESKQIHVLVATAFIANPNNLPVVNHIDSDRMNAIVTNLEWVSERDNVYHSMKQGFFPNKPVLSTDINNNKKAYLSAAQAEKITGINRSSIANVCKGRNKKAGARHWQYITKEEYANYED